MFRAKLHLRGNTLKDPNFFFFRGGSNITAGSITRIKSLVFPFITLLLRGPMWRHKASYFMQFARIRAWGLRINSIFVVRNKRSDVPNYWRCSFHLHFVYERTFARVILKINCLCVL